MPAVKKMHQNSQNNSKAEYVWGHSCQAICLLVLGSFFSYAVPLVLRIQEDIGAKNRSILHKVIDLLRMSSLLKHGYLVGDAYYACGHLFASLLKLDFFIVTRVRSNAVAYTKASPKKYSARGRPKKYGEKIKLKEIFNDKDFEKISVNIYGKEENVSVKVKDLIPMSYKEIVRYVFVIMNNEKEVIFATTDVTLSPQQVIECYSLRYKIEHTFKDFIHTIGGSCYRFWTKSVKKTRIKNEKKRHVITETAYQLYLQLCVITQGILMYIAMTMSEEVWEKCDTWVRTINFSKIPSSSIVMSAMRNTENVFHEFLLSTKNYEKFALFWKRRRRKRGYDPFSIVN